MATTSASLLQRLHAGDDPPAWSRLVDVYRPLVKYWLGANSFGNDCEDLLQEIFTMVARKLPEFQHNGRTGAFRTWMRAITVNVVRDYWRARRNQSLLTGDLDWQNSIASLEDPHSELNLRWDREHDRWVLQRLMEILKPTFQPKTWQAFSRLMLEGATVAEVAKELETTPNAVIIARSRVLRRLRDEAAGMVDN